MSPPEIGSPTAEREALLEAAKLMLVAARTAPKTAGIDDVLTLIVYGEDKDRIATEMEKIGEERGIEGFRRDAKNVRDSEAVVLIGVRGGYSIGLNCGACGSKSCNGFEATEKRKGEDFIGPTCVFKALDLGIALGSAVKIASMLNVDNRIMYRVGTAALRLGMLPEATVAMGVPISAKGKSIYFDRRS
ncbi:MAG: ferredoxin domain-containing protein [Candidatus Bathycorpusculaceae bacterium]